MSSVEELGPGALQSVLDSETRPIVVDFWSPWCAPCRTLRPHMERLAKGSGEKLRFVAVNVEADAEMAQRLNVKALPTVAMFHAGQETERFTGAGILGAINQAIEAS